MEQKNYLMKLNPNKINNIYFRIRSVWETGETVVDENQKYNQIQICKNQIRCRKISKGKFDKHKIDFAVVHFGDVYGQMDGFTIC